LESTIHWMSSSVDVARRFEETVCPFQVDSCFVFDPRRIRKIDNIYGDDSDDDDDDDEEVSCNESEFEQRSQGHLFPKDIERGLKLHDLKYLEQEIKPNADKQVKPQRINRMTQMFNAFLMKNKLKESDPISRRMYQHRRRLVVAVDRRRHAQSDTMWMYEPPKDCREMPPNAVNEWHFNASKQCLFPDENYGKQPLSTTLKEDQITAVNAGPYVLTFSIVYRQRNSMQCYLYWNGQMHRFCPQDLSETKTILRDIFCTESDAQYPLNRGFMESEEGGRMWRNLMDKMKDTEFAYFRRMAH